MTKSFLPPSFTVPSKKDQFFKPKAGENKLRIMSEELIEGYEFFADNGNGGVKPIRKKVNSEIKEDQSFSKDEMLENDCKIEEKTGKPERQNYFWSLLVWNYDMGRFQVWQLTQKTIIEALVGYFDNEKYGDPQNYDIILKKTGEGRNNTKYTLQADPPESVPQEVAEAYNDLDYDPLAIFNDEYPFD